MSLIIVFIGCANKDRAQKEKNEDFSSFYQKFYTDTIFQDSRILKPLEGTIKSWNDEDVVREESWINRKIRITPKEKFLESYKNLKTELLKSDSSVAEKYWIDQSGFFVRRKFILKKGKWYLFSYDISNL